MPYAKEDVMNIFANYRLAGMLLLSLAVMVPGLTLSATENKPQQAVDESASEKQVEITNPKCPVMNTIMEKTAPENMTRIYKGHRIGFCCKVCLGKWDKMSDADREPLYKAAMGENPVEIANPKCPVMGTDMEATAPEKMTRMYKGHRLGFCCEVCLGKWDKMSDAEREPIADKALAVTR